MKKLLVIVLVPVALLVWWVLYRRNLPPEIPFAKVKRETLISTLPTNGKVEPIEWITVRAETAGVVERVAVEQGRPVRAGSALITLQAGGAQADLAAAEARAAQARSELAAIAQGGRKQELTEIENGLVRVRFDKQTAEKDAAALDRLVKKQAATQAEADRARDRIRQADIEIEALERKRAALVGAADRSVSEARLKEAEAAATQARRRIEQSAIRSTLTGAVYSLNVRPGSYVNPGDAVASVGRTERLRVRVYVDEPELGRVEVAQPVIITWDALPGKTWAGTVEKLPTEIVALNTRQVGEVLCSIENPGNELVPGTNVNAEIRTKVVENALTIPKEALRRQNNRQGVLLLAGDHVEWRAITTGATSVTRTQAVAGLAEGDGVALATAGLLKSGDRVRPIFE